VDLVCLRGQQDLAAVLRDVVAVGLRDGAVVHDRGAGRQECRLACDAGFKFTQLGGVQPPQSRHLVGGRAPLQFAQLVHFPDVPRHDQLAALVVCQVLFCAVFLEEGDATAGHRRLRRSRGVIDPRVHDAGVVPGLMLRDGAFLLENRHPHARGRELAGDSEADDAGADDSDVRVSRHNLHNRITEVSIHVAEPLPVPLSPRANQFHRTTPGLPLRRPLGPAALRPSAVPAI
jgi:hypothetical protein